MRVAFLSPCWPPDRFPNGIASYVGAVRRGLGARGVDSFVVTPELEDGDSEPSVSRMEPGGRPRSLRVRLIQRAAGTFSRYLGMQQDSGYRVARAFKAIDRENPLDLVEVEETFGIGAVIRREIETPVVVRLHGPWCVVGPKLGHPKDKEFWMRCAAEYHAIRRASAISSPSLDALEQVRAAYRMELPDARVIPNPVAIPDRDDHFSRAKADPNKILFVGRFDRVKGADILLQAFARVAKDRPALRLIFIGPDSRLIHGGREIGFEEYLREQVPHEVHSQIEFRGARGASEIALERQHAAFSIVSSRYETFSLAAVETMAAGAPLIASRVGGLREIVRDGETGLLFEAESEEDLAEKIEQLLADPDLAARLGKAAHFDVASRFSESVVAAQTHAFYESVLERR
ncbi:MAG: glycosyltransferase family 4 protein [Myxococcota bacterium]|jgi:glycosyltransferase involved in cell wall biosynthesis